MVTFKGKIVRYCRLQSTDRLLLLLLCRLLLLLKVFDVGKRFLHKVETTNLFHHLRQKQKTKQNTPAYEGDASSW